MPANASVIDAAGVDSPSWEQANGIVLSSSLAFAAAYSCVEV